MEDYSQLLRSSATAGLLFGAYWVLKYFCLLGVFAMPALAFLYLLLTLVVPFMAYYLSKRYRDGMPADKPFSFMHGWRYSMMLYFFAAIIVSIPHFYFYARVLLANMDMIMGQMEQVSAAMAQIYGSDWRKVLEEAFNVSPATRVASDIVTNAFWGMLLSIPVGLMLRRKQDPSAPNQD